MSEDERADVAKVLEGFDIGVFVRNTGDDYSDGWAMKILPYIAALARLAKSSTAAKFATIVECDEEIAGPHPTMTFYPGWGYRDEATGVITHGGSDGDGEHWDEEDAEAQASLAGYWIQPEETQ